MFHPGTDPLHKMLRMGHLLWQQAEYEWYTGLVDKIPVRPYHFVQQSIAGDIVILLHSFSEWLYIPYCGETCFFQQCFLFGVIVFAQPVFHKGMAVSIEIGKWRIKKYKQVIELAMGRR